MAKVKEEKLDLRISDKVRVTSSSGGFVTLATSGEMIKVSGKAEMVKRKPDEYYYNILHQAVTRGLHAAVELEKPETVEKYMELLTEFRDEVLCTAEFVETKFKIVKVTS